MLWKVVQEKSVVKEVRKLPNNIQFLYENLLQDLEREGPYPHGWGAKTLLGNEGISVRLNREYRVIITFQSPNILVVKVAHRKEVYR